MFFVFFCYIYYTIFNFYCQVFFFIFLSYFFVGIYVLARPQDEMVCAHLKTYRAFLLIPIHLVSFLFLTFYNYYIKCYFICQEVLKIFSKSVSLPSIHRKESLFEDFYLFPLDNYYYSKYFFICKVQKTGKNLIIFV